MDDLVERLRKASSMPFKEAYRALFTLGADEIELLRAELSAKAWEVIDEKNQEIEHLRNQLNEANARVSEWFDECAKRIGKAAELSNQLEKAKAGLEEIYKSDTRVTDGGKCHDLGPCAEIAAATLFALTICNHLPSGQGNSNV